MTELMTLSLAHVLGINILCTEQCTVGVKSYTLHTLLFLWFTVELAVGDNATIHVILWFHLLVGDRGPGFSPGFSPSMTPDQLEQWLLHEYGESHKNDIGKVKGRSL